MITLSNLKPFEGARKNKKRVGRGTGSGHGKTACKGHKGQKARTGGNIEPGFIGGQMPLYRQLPKRGFKNPFKQIYGVLNVKDINKAGLEIIDLKTAKENGLVKKRYNFLKILGDGEINKSVTIYAHAASQSAIDKIANAGGNLQLIQAKQG